MTELRDFLCDDVIGIVNDYLHGDKDYWENKYTKVMNQLDNCQVAAFIKDLRDNGIYGEHNGSVDINNMMFYVRKYAKKELGEKRYYIAYREVFL